MTERRGKAALLLHYGVIKLWYGLRVNHSWLSIFYPPMDEMLVITRPQRIAILAVGLLSNMAVSAIFFFASPNNDFQVPLSCPVSVCM